MLYILDVGDVQLSPPPLQTDPASSKVVGHLIYCGGSRNSPHELARKVTPTPNAAMALTMEEFSGDVRES